MAESATALKPAITRTMLLFFIVGDILGGGIYALVGEVGDKVGGAIWTAFALAGVIAAFTAASYAELVSKYPSAGGAALFVHRAFRAPRGREGHGCAQGNTPAPPGLNINGMSTCKKRKFSFETL